MKSQQSRSDKTRKSRIEVEILGQGQSTAPNLMYALMFERGEESFGGPEQTM